MPPTLEQRKWVQDVLQVIKLSDHQEIDEVKRKDSLRGEMASGIQLIDKQVALMSLAVDTFFDAYEKGLTAFGWAMLDAEMDETEASTAADIVFKIFLTIAAAAFPEAKLAEKLVEKLVARVGDGVGKQLGEKAVSSIKEVTIGALEKGRDYVKGAPKPSARTFREFAKGLSDASVANQAAMKEAVLHGGESVKDAFRQMATATGTTDGPAGAYANLMVSAGQSFTQRLKASSDPNKLEEVFATEFAGKSGQTPKRGSILDTTRDAGTLYFEITTVTDMRAAKPEFSLGDDTDEKWKLVMLGDKRDAQGAARALKESAKLPWKIALPRKVRIDVYNEVNKRDRQMCGGWLVFGKDNSGLTPDKIEDIRRYDGGEIFKRPEDWLLLAWRDKTVQAAAVANTDIEGSVD